MNWEKIENEIPKVIEELKAEYDFNNPILKNDIFKILEKQCAVVYYPLSDERNRGFHTKRFVKDSLKDFVYINTAKPIVEQIFTAAHELGHVWNVSDKIKERISEVEEFSSKEEEDIIDRFAAELLMPTELFVKSFLTHFKDLQIEVKDFKLEHLIKIAAMLVDDYMVPYESVRRRLIETSIISNEIGNVLLENEETILPLVNVFSCDNNTMVDKETGKCAIPGLRDLIERIEREHSLDSYTLSKIKADFKLDSSIAESLDETIPIQEEILNKWREQK